jgi:hypothetical protein
MIRLKHFHMFTFAGVILLGGGVLGRAQTLDVKTGLWETTVVSETNGMPAIDTSKMTPEQRARIEAALKGRGGRGPSTNVVRTCMTKEKLDKLAFHEMAQNNNSSCKTSVVSSSRGAVDMKMECSGNRKSTGTMHFEAPSRESMKGTIKIAAGDDTHPMTINLAMTGKWLGDDCGDVK